MIMVELSTLYRDAAAAPSYIIRQGTRDYTSTRVRYSVDHDVGLQYPIISHP
jgi:hypothetical protein